MQSFISTMMTCVKSIVTTQTSVKGVDYETVHHTSNAQQSVGQKDITRSRHGQTCTCSRCNKKRLVDDVDWSVIDESIKRAAC